MSSEQIKAKALAASIITLSAFGTLALFGCVPVIAKIGSNAPFSISKIEAFLFQQANMPLPSTEDNAASRNVQSQ
ncbi:hypothetical protein IFO70_12885 [Phormidium tenue FACHB-886]|nr:hypothetical protein [Phormidium tenue FACHB-886]